MDDRESHTRTTLRYALYRWRLKFKASYIEMIATPLEVILTDLEYIQIEDKVTRDKRTNG